MRTSSEAVVAGGELATVQPAPQIGADYSIESLLSVAHWITAPAHSD